MVLVEDSDAAYMNKLYDLFTSIYCQVGCKTVVNKSKAKTDEQTACYDDVK